MGCLLSHSFIIHLHLPSTFSVPGAVPEAEGLMLSRTDEQDKYASSLLELLA